MPDQRLSRRGKVAIALGILGGLAFLLAALVTFLREGDWPAKYVSAALSIFAVMVIAVRRRARRLG